jgi:hypothetical protein
MTVTDRLQGMVGESWHDLAGICEQVTSWTRLSKHSRTETLEHNG